MSAFKAYDIRGKFGIDFNGNDVYRIGRCLPSLFNTTKILIGRDCRLSSPEIFARLTEGITEAGADVVDAGLCTTPAIYWATAKNGFDLSVMITASHNPPEYNGMKVSGRGAIPIGYDTGLAGLEKAIGDPLPKPASSKGTVMEFDVEKEYIEFQRQFLCDLSGLRLTVDASNGMAGLYIRKLLGDAPQYLNEVPDGRFPAHEPNPLEPENVVQLSEAVRKNGSDIGIIFDGDADRVMFTDETGHFIRPDLMIGLLGHYFLEEKRLKGSVLQDIRTSKGVTEYLTTMGAQVHIWRVGRAYAALKLRQTDGIFGGELAGHYYFRDFFYSDSAIMACLIILKLIKRFHDQGIKVSELIQRIDRYANSGEINFRITRKTEAMETLKNHFTASEEVKTFYDFDGYRIEFVNWWFNVRPSNTEPYLRLIVEAESEPLLQQKINEAREVLRPFLQ